MYLMKITEALNPWQSPCLDFSLFKSYIPQKSILQTNFMVLRSLGNTCCTLICHLRFLLKAMKKNVCRLQCSVAATGIGVKLPCPRKKKLKDLRGLEPKTFAMKIKCTDHSAMLH